MANPKPRGGPKDLKVNVESTSAQAIFDSIHPAPVVAKAKRPWLSRLFFCFLLLPFAMGSNVRNSAPPGAIDCGATLLDSHIRYLYETYDPSEGCFPSPDMGSSFPMVCSDPYTRPYLGIPFPTSYSHLLQNMIDDDGLFANGLGLPYTDDLHAISSLRGNALIDALWSYLSSYDGVRCSNHVLFQPESVECGLGTWTQEEFESSDYLTSGPSFQGYLDNCVYPAGLTYSGIFSHEAGKKFLRDFAYSWVIGDRTFYPTSYIRGIFVSDSSSGSGSGGEGSGSGSGSGSGGGSGSGEGGPSSSTTAADATQTSTTSIPSSGTVLLGDSPCGACDQTMLGTKFDEFVASPDTEKLHAYLQACTDIPLDVGTAAMEGCAFGSTYDDSCFFQYLQASTYGYYHCSFGVLVSVGFSSTPSTMPSTSSSSSTHVTSSITSTAMSSAATTTTQPELPTISLSPHSSSASVSSSTSVSLTSSSQGRATVALRATTSTLSPTTSTSTGLQASTTLPTTVTSTIPPTTSTLSTAPAEGSADACGEGNFLQQVFSNGECFFSFLASGILSTLVSTFAIVSILLLIRRYFPKCLKYNATGVIASTKLIHLEMTPVHEGEPVRFQRHEAWAEDEPVYMTAQRRRDAVYSDLPAETKLSS